MRKEIQEFKQFLQYNKSPLTVKSYIRDVSDFLDFIKEKTLEKLTPQDVISWYSSLERKGLSKRSIAQYAYALKKFFEFMGLYQLKVRTPAPRFEPTEAKWIEEEICMELIDRVTPLVVSYDLALRIGEVSFLTVEGYNPTTGEIQVTRLKHRGTYNKYILRLDDWVNELLQEWLDKFGIRRGMMFPISVSTLRKIFKRRAKVVGLDDSYTFHSLRHSRLTHIAIHELETKGSVDIVKLAKFAGHSKLEDTMIYLHIASKYLSFKVNRNANNK